MFLCSNVMLPLFYTFSFKDIASYAFGCLLGSLLLLSLNWYQISTQSYMYHLAKRYIPYVKCMMRGERPFIPLETTEFYFKYFFAKERGGGRFLVSSSRGYQIDAAVLGQPELRNLWISGGVYGLFDTLNLLASLQCTQKVFINIDAWSFRNYIEGKFSLGKSYRRLLSRCFFLEVLKTYLRFVPIYGFGHAYDSHGAWLSSPKYEATYTFNVRKAIAGSRFSWRADVVEAYRTSIKRLQDKGASVTLIKLPFHPEAYKCDIVRRSLCELDKFTDNLAKELGVKVIGTFFPPKDLTAQDCYDTTHVRKSGLRKVLRIKQFAVAEVGK